MTRDLARLDWVARSRFRFGIATTVFAARAVGVTVGVFAVRTTIVAIELIGYDAAIALARARKWRPVCGLLGHDREPWEPFGCARCDTEYNRVRDSARPTGGDR